MNGFIHTTMMVWEKRLEIEAVQRQRRRFLRMTPPAIDAFRQLRRRSFAAFVRRIFKKPGAQCPVAASAASDSGCERQTQLG